ncbi:pupal cuticle protein Edg-84A-like [Eurosta solidaginis]|uniref:pupal cuticle protein Edg-84A-like n=1 Tax=Eurosta solidaginis TaxID=178769 RepID=UPI0035313656
MYAAKSKSCGCCCCALNNIKKCRCGGRLLFRLGAANGTPTTLVNFCIFALFVTASVVYATGENNDDYDSYPSYRFNYNVQDDITGDIKSQMEQRDGDVVKGQYSLQEPDGYRRTVEYTADSLSGFKATVHREQLSEPVKLLSSASSNPQNSHQNQDEVKQSPVATIVSPIQPAFKYEALSHKSFLTSVGAPTYIRTYSTPKLLHETPAAPHEVIHHAPATAVHLTPTSPHYVHVAPAPAPTIIAHHSIQTDTNPTVFKTSFSSPHISYVY